ncbi:hypothetical protein DMI65_00670 [Escherichia coli]|nr:hypothetical protein [Escherichia coli]
MAGFLKCDRAETRQWGGLTLTLIIASVGIAGRYRGDLTGVRSPLPYADCAYLIGHFIEFWRGVPLITVLFMSSVMLPLFMAEGTSIDKLIRALVGVILFQSAYVAEVVRGGLQALPKGNMKRQSRWHWVTGKLRGLLFATGVEAGNSGLVNTIIALFKDTSTVIIIGLFDLSVAFSRQPLIRPVGYVDGRVCFAALIYWIFCFSMSRYSQHLEKRFNTGRTPH